MVTESYLSSGTDNEEQYFGPPPEEWAPAAPDPWADQSLGVVQYSEPAGPAPYQPAYTEPDFSQGVVQYTEPAAPAYEPGYFPDTGAYGVQQYDWAAPPAGGPYESDVAMTQANIQAQLDAGAIDQQQAAYAWEQAWNTMTGAQDAAQYDLNQQAFADYYGEPQQYDNLRQQGIETGAIRGDIFNTQGAQALGDIGQGALNFAGGAYSFLQDIPLGIPQPGFSVPVGAGYTTPGGGTYDTTVGEVSAIPTPYRDEISNVLGDVGGVIGQGLEYNPFTAVGARAFGALTGVSTEDIGRFIGENAYPQNVVQAAAMFVPGIGEAPGLLSFIDDVARFGADAAIARALGGVARSDALDNAIAVVSRLAREETGSVDADDILRALAGARAGPVDEGLLAGEAYKPHVTYRVDTGERLLEGSPGTANVSDVFTGGTTPDPFAVRLDEITGNNPLGTATGPEGPSQFATGARQSARQSPMPETDELLGQPFRGGPRPFSETLARWAENDPAAARAFETEYGARTAEAPPVSAAPGPAVAPTPEPPRQPLTGDLHAASRADVIAEAQRLGAKVDEELLRYGNDFAREPELIKVQAARDAEAANPSSLARDAEGFARATTEQRLERNMNPAEQAWFDARHAEAQADAERVAGGAGRGELPPSGISPGGSGRSLQPPGNAADIGLMDWINLPRSMVLGADLGYLLRQGGFLLPAHLNTYREALLSLAQALGKADGIKLYNDMTKESLWAKRGITLDLSDFSGTGMTNREIEYFSALVERIPGVGKVYEATNRIQATFLNKVRSDLMDDFIRRWGDKVPTSYLQHYANYLARATGKGNMGPKELQGVAALLSNLMISPRFTTSLVQRAGYLNPNTGGVLFGPVWREAMQDTGSFLATGTAVMATAAAAGAQVEWDPRDSDFGTIKIGDTRVDIWAGYRPLARSVFQGVTGQQLSSTSTLKDRDAWDVLGTFLRDRLTPGAQLGAYALGEAYGGKGVLGSGIGGNELSQFARPEWFRSGVTESGKFWDQALSFMVPAFIQDTIQGMRYEGLAGGLGIGLGAFLGLGMGTYKTSVFERQQDERNSIVESVTGLKGVTYDQLTGLEKAKVNEELAKSNPGLLAELQKAEADINRGKEPSTIDKAFTTLDEAKLSRQAIEQAGDARLQSLLDRITTGERGDNLRRELQDTRAGLKAATDAIYQSPGYKEAQKTVGSYMDGRRVAGSVGDDVLSSKPGTIAGTVVDFLGLRQNEAPGQPAPNAEPFQKIVDVYRSIPEQTKAGNGGYVDWDFTNQLQQAALTGLKAADPEWGNRLEFNTQPAPTHPIEELYFSALRSYDAYQAGSWWPDQGAKWTPQDYNNWIDWRVSHPQDEALMYLFGYTEDVTSQEAVNLIHQMSPGATVTVRR